MIFISLAQRAACKISYLIPYDIDYYLLVYVNDSYYNNMRKYFDLFGIRHYRMIDHIREKRSATKFNEIAKRVVPLHNYDYLYTKKFNNSYHKRTLNSENNNFRLFYTGTTKAELKYTLHGFKKIMDDNKKGRKK